MMTIALVSVIKHYHINRIHVFWDTRYIHIYRSVSLHSYPPLRLSISILSIYIYIGGADCESVSMCLRVRVCVFTFHQGTTPKRSKSWASLSIQPSNKKKKLVSSKSCFIFIIDPFKPRVTVWGAEEKKNSLQSYFIHINNSLERVLLFAD